MSAFYFVAVAIIFTVCISILCLIFVPKILATKKPPVEILRTLGRFGGRQISRAQSDGVSESESDGIKILSTPVAVAQLEEENRQLEEENRKLKNFVVGSGRRISSVLIDEEAGPGSRRQSQSHMSNGSMAESDAVPATEKEKLVTFESSNNDGIENHTTRELISSAKGELITTDLRSEVRLDERD